MGMPEGFVYRPEFITAEEERELLAHIAGLEFGHVIMRGVKAKRRVIHYGYVYGYESFRLTPGPGIPEWLEPLRTHVAAEAGLAGPGDLAETLITEYPPGATIGWHRDAPPFGIVIAVSLAGPARLRFRRGEAGTRETAELEVEPRSLYILDGPARTDWQHHIPPTPELRYSITFRTLRRKRAPTP